MELAPLSNDDETRLAAARERLVHTWTTHRLFAGDTRHPREFRVSMPPELRMGPRNARYDYFTLGPVDVEHIESWTRQALLHGFRLAPRGQQLEIGVPHSFYASQSRLPIWVTVGCLRDVAPIGFVAACFVVAALGVGGGSVAPAWHALTALSWPVLAAGASLLVGLLIVALRV